MNIAVLLLRELRHHRVNALLGFVGLTMAVALLVSVRMTSAAAERETRRVMRDMGFNLRIIPRTTDMDHFWAHGFSDQTMPEETTKKLAAQRGIFVSFNHLTPALEGRIETAGKMSLLTGIGETIVSPDEGKQPMGFRIKKGEVHLGSEAARRLQARRGETVKLGTRDFRVEKILSESGTDEDVRIFASLGDAQQLLKQPGRINEIKAIDCLCLTADKDPLAMLRRVIEEALPEARVLQLRTLADARAKQRQMAERYSRFAGPLALSVGGAWLVLLGWLNVRERRVEIGLWRALGHGSPRIAALFMGKAMLMGLAAALCGYFLGTAIALHFGPGIFQVTAKALQSDPRLLVQALWMTPLFSALASLPPTMRAVAQDPAEALRAD